MMGFYMLSQRGYPQGCGILPVPSRCQKWVDAQVDLEEEGQELAKKTLFTLAFGEH
jgi:hypothetical protein